MTKPQPSSKPTAKQESCCKLGIFSSSPFIPPTSLSTQVPVRVLAPPRTTMSLQKLERRRRRKKEEVDLWADR